MSDMSTTNFPSDISVFVRPGAGNSDTVQVFSANQGRYNGGAGDGALSVRTRSQGFWTLEQTVAGGSVLGGIGAAVGKTGALTVLYKGGSGGTLTLCAQQNDGSWSGEQDFGLAINGDVCAYTHWDDTIGVFYAGADNTLRWLCQRSDGQWDPADEQNLGGQVGGGITMIIPPGSTQMQLFYRTSPGMDAGEVKWRYQDPAGGWSVENPLGEDLAVDRIAAIVLPGTDVLQIFYRRPDNQVGTAYRAGNGGWVLKDPLGGFLSTNVAVQAIPGSQVVQLFYGGGNRALYTRWRESNGHWSGESSFDGIVGSDPVASIVDDQLQVFYRRTGQSIWSRTRQSNGNWSAEQNASPISHVFVLMLENHSFDNIFGRSGISGLNVATTSASNSYTLKDCSTGTFYVDNNAPMQLTYGPEHGFDDTVVQLCGADSNGIGVKYPPGGPYPKINTSGFVQDYANSIGCVPDTSVYGRVMQCFDTPNALPVIYDLATNFTVCDAWFASLPGPTWPNRFFVHAASSGGFINTPNHKYLEEWYGLPGGGMTFPNGTVFNAIDTVGLKWRIYNDEDNKYSDNPYELHFPISLGFYAQAGALKGINNVSQIHNLADFASDLAGDYPYQYTFIEPNYGFEPLLNLEGPTTNVGGSSQHPIDDMYGGEGLIKAVYETIRASPLWNSSLLIITYDEHGGFYDSATPPGIADGVVAPGDGSEQSQWNTEQFDFKQYGVRVPAVAISPWIPEGVDHTVYDHTSVSATLMALFGTPHLTQRDLAAHDLTSLLNLLEPRTDAPSTLPGPAPTTSTRVVDGPTVSDDDPLPDDEILHGFLCVALKARVEICDGDEAKRQAHIAESRAVQTCGQARRYLKETHDMIVAAREAGGRVPVPSDRPPGRVGSLPET